MSHIKNIEIKNFKSIRHQTIDDCRRINVFIGYPNVGKSNILEAFGLFSALQLKKDDFKFNEICRVKHFAELFFNQDINEPNQITVNQKISVDLSANSVNGLNFRISLLVDHAGNPDSDTLLSAGINSNNYFINSTGSPSESNYKHIVGPIKKYEFLKDTYLNGKYPSSLAIPYGNNLLDILYSHGGLRKDIRDIVQNFGLKLQLDKIDDSIKFQKELTDGTVISFPYHQMADTLRRLIFYKAAVQTNKNSILLFEEPEAHMFPPYISKLTGDIVNDENGNQFFLATHSPFVMNDLISNTEKNDLSVYIVSFDNETGETVISRMNEEDVDEAYQFGYDFFMNINNFLPQKQHD